MDAAVQSEKGRQKLNSDGYFYTYDKDSKDGLKKFWRCDQRAATDCKVRVHTNAETCAVIKQLHQHNHGSDAAAVEVVKIRTAIKRRAAETMEIPSQILNFIQEVDQATLGRMPDKDAFWKTVQRVRNELQLAPPAPLDLQSLVVPDTFRFYEAANGQKELFLLGDTGAVQQRVLLNGRESHSIWAHQMQNLFVDGTFRLAPPLFTQVYAILAKRGGFVFPVLYALLPNKRRETYHSMFELIKQLWTQLTPVTIAIDFEIAAISAIRDAYPNAQLHGCLFHLTKNLRRHLADSALIARYNNEPDFSLQARMIVALAFVPVVDLDIAFDELSQHLPDDLQPILDWFEDNYLGRMNRNGRRRPATFPSHLWTLYDRVINGHDRTNNHAEAAHRRIQSELDIDHPSIWKFIDGLRRIQKGRDMVYEQYVRGMAPPQKKRKYKQADQRIRTLVQDYANRNRVEYLRGIAHNFLME